MPGYRIRRRAIDGLEVVRLEGAGGFAELIPELGGMVRQIALGDGREILGPDADGELRANPAFRGRILFPFSDRIPGGRYRFAGRTLELPANASGDSLHGLVYATPFLASGERSSEEGAEIRLSVSPDRYRCPGYPFRLELGVRYRLDGDGFAMSFEIRNTGADAAPFGVGWHPYFSLGEGIEAASFRADADGYLPTDERMLPIGRILPVDGTAYDFRLGRRLDGLTLDNTITAPRSGFSTLTAGDRRIELHQSAALFRFLQLYTPEDPGSIAIEPVASAPNAFNLPALGVSTLAAGESARGVVRVRYASR